MAGRTKSHQLNPIGTITRGTTGVNRLRRSDRWLINDDLVIARLHAATDPLVVDLGYGASPWTTFELAARLRTVRPDVRVVGLEIDPERVVPGRDGVSFARGGFELAGLRPVLVRAFNVLRQYPESAVPDAWSTILSGLAPGGLLVDGTCDELGRLQRLGPPRPHRTVVADPGLGSVHRRPALRYRRASTEGFDPSQCAG